jgi:hypothetical protein
MGSIDYQKPAPPFGSFVRESGFQAKPRLSEAVC